jgi:hypothetical protein
MRNMPQRAQNVLRRAGYPAGPENLYPPLPHGDYVDRIVTSGRSLGCVCTGPSMPAGSAAPLSRAETASNDDGLRHAETAGKRAEPRPSQVITREPSLKRWQWAAARRRRPRPQACTFGPRAASSPSPFGYGTRTSAPATTGAGHRRRQWPGHRGLGRR